MLKILRGCAVAFSKHGSGISARAVKVNKEISVNKTQKQNS
jgi:hypothetical protein